MKQYLISKDKYNGEIDYQYDSEYFKVDVIVPLQNKGKI